MVKPKLKDGEVHFRNLGSMQQKWNYRNTGSDDLLCKV